MRGAFAHYARNGYRRLAQQAVYFAVPFGLGASPLSNSSRVTSDPVS